MPGQPPAPRGDSAPPGRTGYRLRALSEVVAELANRNDPDGIPDAFLLLGMGALGATKAFLLLRERGTGEIDSFSRGASPSDAARLRENAPELLESLLPATRRGHAVTMSGSHLRRDPHLPEDTGLITAWQAEDGLQALLGFGPPLGGEDYSAEDAAFAESLARVLETSLAGARAARAVRGLGEDLAARNLRLEAALADARESHAVLDRRAMHLRNLYEATRELAGIVSPGELPAVFLLHLCGSFGVSGAWLVLDDGAHPPHAAFTRGFPEEVRSALASREGRTAMLSLFVAQKDRIPDPMQTLLVDDPAMLSRLPGQPMAALLLTLDGQTRGLAALGARLVEPRPLGPGERNLLSSMGGAFLSTLKNARLYADLSQRNEELRRTIADLTTARVEIDLLTRARERILSALRGEMDRLRRPSALAMGLIVAVGVILGLLYNLASPGGIALLPRSLSAAGLETVTPSALPTLMAEGGVLIDARPPEFHQQERIAGSINLTPALFDILYSMHLAGLPPETPIVIYGRTISRLYDLDVADRLGLAGHERVLLLEGGLEAWKKAGHAVEPRP